MKRLVNIENPSIIITAPDELINEVGGNCYQVGGSQPLTYAKNLWRLEEPNVPKGIDEAAEEYALDVKAKPFGNLVKDAFKDGVKWRDAQIAKLPDNVDEAAVQAHIKLEEEGSLSFLNIFKAGAEWMAWLGVKIGETKIYLEDDGDEPPYSQQWLDLESTEFKIPDGAFENGDEVDVILRKKH